jgi:hypothetical protein
VAHRPGFVPFDGERVAAADVLRDFGEVADRGDKVGYVAPRLRFDLAGVERFDLGDDVESPLDLVGQAVQNRAPFVRRQCGPAGFVERFLGGGDGGVYVFGREVRDCCQHIARTGIMRFKRAAIGCGYLLAAHERSLQRFFKKRIYLRKPLGHNGSHLNLTNTLPEFYPPLAALAYWCVCCAAD